GCASAALPPMIITRSVFLISVQELVIAPRPNVGPKLDTVGPCQTRAWLSNPTIPRERTTFHVAQAVSLVVADAARKPAVVQRLTVWPLAFFSMKFASRSSLMARAILSNASSQEISWNLSLPGAR